MAAMQLSFSLRTAATCQTVHLVGSWDGYQGQIPLSKDSRKAGAWKGTFRFQNTTLQAGQRYWYYYIIDGYHVSHDPAKESVLEPTTGRQLNTLDIPASTKSSSSSSSHRSSRRYSRDVAHGRPLSPSRLQHPRPQKPHATRQLRQADYAGHATVDELTQRFANANMDAESDSEFESESDDDSDVPSLGSDCSSRPGSATSSRSSRSSRSSSSSCSCDRYGITRRGDRVRLDCGGSRCGGKYDQDSCSEFESDEEEQVYYERSTRRQGVVVRR